MDGEDKLIRHIVQQWMERTSVGRLNELEEKEESTSVSTGEADARASLASSSDSTIVTLVKKSGKRTSPKQQSGLDVNTSPLKKLRLKSPSKD